MCCCNDALLHYVNKIPTPFLQNCETAKHTCIKMFAMIIASERGENEAGYITYYLHGNFK
jgi:hypothetical protein